MIQIENLQFNYSKSKNSKDKKLFEGLNLSLEPGKIYGLLGRNGTGKSTLLKLIIGAIFPKQGSVKVNQFDAYKRKPEMLAELFFLSEDYQVPPVKISAFLKANKPFYPRFNESKFWELIQIFELGKGEKLNSISYGQKKKVLISFAIATGCKYLLLDEPTNGLDIPSKSQFRKALLKGFIEDQTIIISTHQIRDLNQLLESVIMIEDGKIILNQDVFELENKLLFTKSLSQEDIPNLIYAEQVAGGFIHITPNETSEPSDIDLELLFNAVLQNKQQLNNYL